MADYVEVFIGELRERAADRELESSPTAGVYRRVAEELEAKRIAFLNAEPTLEEAMRESGYTDAALRRLKREGKWSGRRIDLPRRPGHPPPVREQGTLAENILRNRRRVGR